MGDPYDLNDEQYESVLALSAPQRYEHFLKRICDTERIYLLEDQGTPVILSDDTGDARSQLPLWPHPRYAQVYRERQGGTGHASIDLRALLEEVLPDLAEADIDVAVFPSPEGKAPVVAPERLREDILAYHDEWYGGWPK
jgi:Protein of unknown function (DUF2750)